MKFWTAQYKYPGPYRLDITVKGQDPFGKLFAPTWGMVDDYLKSGKTDGDKQVYVEKYHAMMLNVINNNTKAWNKLLAMPQVVLVCFCANGDFCHRHLLTHYLIQYGAQYCGEIEDFSKWNEKSNDILEFKGENSWLSNFAPCKFTHLDVEYASTEAFYQAWKFTAIDMIEIKVGDELIEVNARDYICKQPANVTKQLGKLAKVPWNWDIVRLEVMKTALEYKFVHNLHYRSLLKATGNVNLVEGNWWHDNFWGNCNCPKCRESTGKNMLGKLIMDIRSRLD